MNNNDEFSYIPMIWYSGKVVDVTLAYPAEIIWPLSPMLLSTGSVSSSFTKDELLDSETSNEEDWY